MSSMCHSHTTSHATQSSQGAHRRNDSWGQHALKLAKYTASGALCGMQDQTQTGPMDEKGTAIEGAIKATDTKVIQLGKQRNSVEKEEFILIEKALFVPDYAALCQALPKILHGSWLIRARLPLRRELLARCCIALSTPPPSDETSRKHTNLMSIPIIPTRKARGILTTPTTYSTRFYVTSVSLEDQTLLVSPSSPEMMPLDFNVGANDMSMRHRFPPQRICNRATYGHIHMLWDLSANFIYIRKAW